MEIKSLNYLIDYKDKRMYVAPTLSIKEILLYKVHHVGTPKPTLFKQLTSLRDEGDSPYFTMVYVENLLSDNIDIEFFELHKPTELDVVSDLSRRSKSALTRELGRMNTLIKCHRRNPMDEESIITYLSPFWLRQLLKLRFDKFDVLDDALVSVRDELKFFSA